MREVFVFFILMRGTSKPFVSQTIQVGRASPKGIGMSARNVIKQFLEPFLTIYCNFRPNDLIF